ncbi:ATP-binding cassette domain-containing protein [Thermococcus sp. Bubb.Bath]|uniref:ATP-binding cassette domain-containing protein n=1 Tax=Thermococcus sp. Bubb.Bath TaxID=1638242 RepID=UPI00143BB6C4|nr:ATP-binding cassette domain-containing protein [Thermococcus sp. Bubb.Bath]NJF24619.1 ATP-binding cassette domain-containing protein [Thermococcus sp. Bubb.Bath]
MALLEVENLSIDLGEFHLRDVSLSVADNDYLTIIGPTGAGKSVLLEAIAGFYPLPKGRVILKGRDITGEPPEKRGMSIVYQDYVLFPHMTVFENIAFGLRKRGLSSAEIEREVRHIAEELHIDHLLHRKPGTLSGGEQQRTALARALVVRPRVLLMDEPFSALDAKTREKLRSLVKAVIAEYGTTVLHVTHDFEDVFALAKHVAVMKDGRIVQFGTPEEVFSRPAGEFIADFVRTNLLRGEAIRREDGLTSIRVGNVILRTIDDAEGEVTLSLRPEDIILAREPAECSARNIVPVLVRSMERRGHLIWLDLSSDEISLRAVITPNAAELLNIKPGEGFYAMFKAGALRVIK